MRILIVDDDPFMRLFLGDVMREGGFEVCEAGSVDEARQSLPGVDIVLLDMVLSGQECGLVLLPEIAQAGASAILVTGTNDAELHLSAMRQGAFDVMSKPIVPERMLTTAARAAERVRVTRETAARVGWLRDQVANLMAENSELTSRLEKDSLSRVMSFFDEMPEEKQGAVA
jgi:DNA-binding NtrC family response regulator